MIHPRDRIHGKIGSVSKKLDEDDLPRIHHEMMKEYGWIPIEEFRRLPIPTLWGLWHCIQEDRKREYDEAKESESKMKSGRRR